MNDTAYYKVYKSRLAKDGNTYKDQIENLARKSFQAYLSETPNRETIVCKGFDYDVAILTNKQDEFRLSKLVLSDFRVPLKIGSLIQWSDHNVYNKEAIDFWLIWKQEQNALKDYNRSLILRCNHKLKWVADGVKYEQYVYEFSSKEGMIRSTFKSRIQELIVSEPNKFMEVIMPETDKISREQRFIVDGEAWYVIEMDRSSAPGILYLTLGETTKDRFGDSLIDEGDDEDLANSNELGSSYISVLENTVDLTAGQQYTIYPKFYNNGELRESALFNFYVKDKLEFTGTHFSRAYSSSEKITVKLKDNPALLIEVNIQVGEEFVPTNYLTIDGNSEIKWSRSSDYFVRNVIDGVEVPIEEEVIYQLSPITLGSYQANGTTCTLTANSNRLIGDLILTATVGPITASKTIKIIPIW